MKKTVSAIMALVVIVTMLTIRAFATDINFSDISGHWAEDTINKWKEQGIISGYPDGTFKPDNPVTRAELAKIITLAFDLQQSLSYDYCDIDDSAWYYPYMIYAAHYIPVYPLPMGFESNIPYMQNPSEGDIRFLPECSAIRMHVSEALVEIKMQRDELTIETPPIDDVQSSLIKSFKDEDYKNLLMVHPPAVPANVLRMFNYTWLAKELEIIQGDSDGYFRPYDEITRAELLTIIDRVLS